MLKVTRIRAGKYDAKLRDGRKVRLEGRKGSHGRYWIARDMHGDLTTANTLGELRFKLETLAPAKAPAKPADPGNDARRDEYRAVMSRSGLEAGEFNASVALVLGKAEITAPTADQYLQAAKLVETACVCTDGKYYSGGSVVNGEYTGRIGTCYRCNGKSYQTDADRRRNYGYDARHRSVG